MTYHALGRAAESNRELSNLIQAYERDAAYNIAYVVAFRGEVDRAFAWLDKAVEYGDPGLSEIPGWPLFDNIREDPRWLPFLRSVGYAPEQLASIEFTINAPR